MSGDIELIIEDWGLIPYAEASSKQEDYVQKIISGERKETLVFCSHPAIVTLGRGTKGGDVFAWKGPTAEVNRGGRATYHGPSQLIMYPLISIDEEKNPRVDKKIKPRDLHQYMRVLEESVVLLLKELGVQSEGRSLQTQVGEDVPEEATGVWIDGKKVASIGIGVRKWVTFHGVALNVDQDPRAFQGMNPCGFKSEQMTSLEEVTGKKWSRDELRALWIRLFLKVL